MAAHVLECRHESLSIGRIVILSPTPVADARFAWAQDQGRGLNEELTAFRTSEPAQSMIFIHGDLPLLVPEEIEALIQAAGGGCALAPDRHGSGTNRSEEHTSELQSLMRISYAVFCLKKKREK